MGSDTCGRPTPTGPLVPCMFETNLEVALATLGELVKFSNYG